MEAHVHTEGSTVLPQIMIETLGLGLVLEDECRAKVHFLEIKDLQDPRMLDALEYLKFPGSSTDEVCAGLCAHALGKRVNADPALSLYADVSALPVLVSFTL